MIIGLIGQAGSGKTTMANMMAKLENTTVLSFATPLKNMLERAGICSRHELFVEKTWFSRKMMQLIGTDLIRNQIDEDFWIKAMRDQIYAARKLMGPNMSVIVDDVRFRNEVWFIRSIGGVIVRIKREGLLEDLHTSETDLNGMIVDHTVQNAGRSFSELEKMVDYVLNLIKEDN